MILNNKIVFKLVILLWLLAFASYMVHTKPGERSHDFQWHIEYTEILVKQHRLPTPYECWEGYHPPLYYLINSFIVPESLIIGDKVEHINYVRALSALYGLFSLLMILWLLQYAGFIPLIQLIVISFICTTPNFILIFSTYTNDSLSAFLSISTLVLSYILYNKWSNKLAIMLFFISSANFHTKYLAIPPAFMIALIIVYLYLKNLILKKSNKQSGIKIITVLCLSFLSFLPYAFFHNYHYAGKIFPTNFERTSIKLQAEEVQAVLETVFRIPLLQHEPNEWDDPWVHTGDANNKATKHKDYFPFVFINSIIGQYSYSKPDVNIFWAILLIHFIILLFSIVKVFSSALARLSGIAIFSTHFIHITSIFFVNVYNRSWAMDFRFISWSWVAWAILYACSLKESKSDFLRYLMIVGIILHIYILATAVSL